MSLRGPLEKDTCRDYVIPSLTRAGWNDDQIIQQYPVTDGRIVPRPHGVSHGRTHRRERELRADYLLEHSPGFAVAVVEAKRALKLPADGLQQAKRYAELLDLPLAYSTNGRGIVEHDYDTGREQNVTEFPSPAAMLARFRAWKGIDDDRIAADLRLPFNRDLRTPSGDVKEPRYYQRVAIERVLEAILQQDRNRVLITMATGTGKTFVALQILWKLWSSSWRGNRKPRFLYLADRNILVDQPIAREFRPVFGDAIWKLRGEAKHGREVYFALYQALADTGDALGFFRDYAPDYFDLVVVDECHRGSANETSSWREILKYFSPAVQLGMTATPLRNDNVDTYRYFGNPVYEYSLAQGIEDGFLAPYRVRRVVLSPDAHGWAPAPGELDRFGREVPPGVYGTSQFERVVSLLMRTEAAARHLTSYLESTDPLAKTIVFCVDSEHADQMRQALTNANADRVRQHPNYVVRIVSAEGDVGVEHLGTFADVESDTPVIATTSKLLSTGVDLPTVKNIVLFKPIGSIVEFKQIIGRGTRLYPDDDKLSFDIVDYSGATALFEDPEFDGPPEALVHEEIDESGTVVATPVVESPEPQTDGGEETDPTTLEDQGARKFYVDGGEAYVTVEGFYLPDSSGTGLHLVEYREYVANQVRRLFTTPAELRERWRSHVGRQEVIDALEARGISFADAAERTGLADADALDVLVHVAWNAPVITRHDRVRRLRKEHRDWLASFVPEARSILDNLLAKYAEHGVSQLDDLRVLEVPPLSDLGTPVEIAARFGGPEALRTALVDLETRLYAA
jgi:type I restriction enzyme R subunit